MRNEKICFILGILLFSGLMSLTIPQTRAEDLINEKPTATISSIGLNPTTNIITFNGYGTDPDGTITEYEWSSSIDGILSTSKIFTKSANDLSTGLHTIYFRVKDDDGEWSYKVSEILAISQIGNDDGNGDDNGNGEPEPKPLIAGFNLLILLGIIGIATPILIKKIKKRQ